MTDEQVERWIAAIERQAKAAEGALANQTRAVTAADSRRELVWELLKSHPEVTGLTDLALVDLCIKRVDAFLIRFPASTSGAA